jgi:ribose-phosphate pyrophosphokinase
MLRVGRMGTDFVFLPFFFNLNKEKLRMEDLRELLVFSGNSNRPLAEKIVESLSVLCSKKLGLGDLSAKRFSDGETRVKVGSNVRLRDAFIIQSASTPVNETYMELLIVLDALKRSSPWRITAVIPYYGYGRQDKKTEPRVPMTAKLIAGLIQLAGANRVITMDLHSNQIQGFFEIPVDNLYAQPVFLRLLRERFGSDIVIVAPDAGGFERATSYAKKLSCGRANLTKSRPEPGKLDKEMFLTGDVKGRVCVIVDDMADTGGTLILGAETLLAHGAKEVHAFCTHPVLSGEAIEKISSPALSSLVVTDTIALNAEAKSCPKIRVVSVADLFARAILASHNGDSVSGLFEE